MRSLQAIVEATLLAVFNSNHIIQVTAIREVQIVTTNIILQGRIGQTTK